MIIIDTDVLIEIMDKKSTKGEEIFQKMEKSNESFAITSITLFETLYGLLKKNKNVPLLSLFRVYGFSKDDAERSAKLEIELEKNGKKVKRTDMMIAAIVINARASLCTFDQDFQVLKEHGLLLF